mmetsp:Transcript_59463/g.158244  ORF Transcript_59463/g.158244 Transcript_59463/m.158244 type:complete len:118 (-) Transcript_59463:1890-2243(-)
MKCTFLFLVFVKLITDASLEFPAPSGVRAIYDTPLRGLSLRGGSSYEAYDPGDVDSMHDYNPMMNEDSALGAEPKPFVSNPTNIEATHQVDQRPVPISQSSIAKSRFPIARFDLSNA